MTTNTTPTSGTDPAEIARALAPAKRQAMLHAAPGKLTDSTGARMVMLPDETSARVAVALERDGLAHGSYVLTDRGRAVHDALVADIAATLPQTQRDALTSSPSGNFCRAATRATMNGLIRRGLATHRYDLDVALTDLGRAVHAVVVGDGQQPTPMRQQPEQQHQAADAPTSGGMPGDGADQPGAVDETGECVHCGQTVRVGAFTVLGSRTVTENHDEPAEHPGERPRPCIGSLVPPRTSDGDLYLFRRDALANAEAARDRAEQVWRDVAADVSAGLRPAVAFSGVSAELVVRLTALSDQWVLTAVVGNWPEAIAQALHDLTAERRHTANPFTAAHDEVRRAAVREWLDEIAGDVKAAHPEFVRVLGIR